MLSILRPSIGAEFGSVLTWRLPPAFTWRFPENLPHATHVPPEALSVPKPNGQLAGEGGSQGTGSLLLTCPGLVLVAAGLSMQRGPSHAQPGQYRQLSTMDHFITLNRYPRDGHRQV